MFEGHETSAKSPKTVGRYLLLDQIGSGGMAIVHMGRLQGPVGFSRMVAIKRLRQEYVADPDITAMLIDEARLAAHIHHPNVVGMLDVVTEEDELYLVMEYVHGESLAFLARGLAARGQRLPPQIAANIVAGALHGLHAAHEAVGDAGQALGIVHRDVSPQNILVGVDGTPRVLDFGVAKAADRLSTTRVGQVKGKIRYMAPEQILAKPVGPWTDVWSASVTLWEALTGKQLFPAKNDMVLVKQVLEEEIRSPRAYAPEVPLALAEVVMTGLVRDASRRVRSALDMARAIEAAAGLVASHEIGDWIKREGRERLEARAKRMAELDRTPLPRTRVLTPRTSTMPPTAASRHTAPSRRRTHTLYVLAGLAVMGAGLYVSRGTFSGGPQAGTASPAEAPPTASAAPSASSSADRAAAEAPAPSPAQAPSIAPPTSASAAVSIARPPTPAPRTRFQPRSRGATDPSATPEAPESPSARPTSDLPFPVPSPHATEPAEKPHEPSDL